MEKKNKVIEQLCCMTGYSTMVFGCDENGSNLDGDVCPVDSNLIDQIESGDCKEYKVDDNDVERIVEAMKAADSEGLFDLQFKDDRSRIVEWHWSDHAGSGVCYILVYEV